MAPRRGYRGVGGGAAAYIEAAPEFRATSVQLAGLYPFSGGGAGAPITGVPLGRDSFTGATVGCDPISWFARANLISNPSCVVLGRPGLGKSSLVCRMALGLAGYGVTPLVFGDLRPDYADLVRALGGRVVSLGRGQGSLNVLDPGAALSAAQWLTGNARRQLTAEAHGRRLNMVAALVALNRQGMVTDAEEALLSVALNVLDDRHAPGDATLPDLIAVLEDGPEPVRMVTLARSSERRYRSAVDPLETSLMALCNGALGDTFAHKTTVPIDLSGPLSIDVSGIGEADEKLTAAVLLAAWSDGFGAVHAHNALAAAGLEPRRNFFVVMDECWRVLRAGDGNGLVDRVDALTRLNRASGVGTVSITHSLADMVSLSDPTDAVKARGFAQRAGFVICMGLPAAELAYLEEVMTLTDRERQLVTSWSTPPSWNPETGKEAAPPGRGKALIKIGNRTGIAVDVLLTDRERRLHDTNTKWKEPEPA